MDEKIQQLEARIKDLEGKVKKRDYNQIQLPLDDISRNVLNLSKFGLFKPLFVGGNTNQTINLTGNAQSITVPSASQILAISLNGVVYNLLIQ